MPSEKNKPITLIHPFPARMASEIALQACQSLSPQSTVLDPMAGSGTVPRIASESGHSAVGFDLDPLAVLLSRVWTTALDSNHFLPIVEKVVARAKRMSVASARLPWIDDDPETRQCVDYWFARPQQRDLRRLAYVLKGYQGSTGDALRVALSRLIITKERGASLGADVSHSRPHRVRDENDFTVFDFFTRSASKLLELLRSERLQGTASIQHGDARNMTGIATGSVDAVITSPPYLNAIDYLRGHRLTLVWLGHTMAEIRELRAKSIGAERAPSASANAGLAAKLTTGIGSGNELPIRERQMVNRYALDMHAFMLEVERVLRPGGRAILVVGNSCIRGVYVANSQIVSLAASVAGLELHDQQSREIPASRRYLPPPSIEGSSKLQNRMRLEVIQTYRKASVA